MKRIIFLVILVFLFATTTISANHPLFLVMNQSRNQIDIIGTDSQLINSLSIDSKPVKLLNLPDSQGYVLLNEGSSNLLGSVKANASLQFINSNLTQASNTISFSGILQQEIYLDDSHDWIILTADKSNSTTINIVNLVTNTHHQYNLNSMPVDFQLSPNKTRIAAITVTGIEENPESQVTVIDLAANTTQIFNVSHNPGAVFFTNEAKLLVACGGYRESMKYSLKALIEKTNKATPAQIHQIDLTTNEITAYEVGYSPLVIMQDHNNSEKFYLASVNEAYFQQASGMFRILENDVITTEIPIKTEPNQLVATPTGNICLLGRTDFYLINPETKSILSELKFNLKPEELKISQNGTVGYLSVVNSSIIREINLLDGTCNEIKLSSSLLKMFNLAKLLPTNYPPVIKSSEAPSDSRTTINYRTFFSTNYSKLYSLSGLKEVSVTDLASRKTINKIKFKGNAFGIYPDPNGKYIIVSTNEYWHLIDPTKKKADLSLLVNDQKDEHFSRTGYISPDGKTMVISAERQLFVVDLINAKLISKIKTKTREPLIAWP